MDKDSGLIHSVETAAANVHDLTPAAELLHGDEEVVYAVATGFCEAVAGYQDFEKRPEMEWRLDDLVETAKAHLRAKGEHPFRVIKQQFGFQKTRLRGMLKNRGKVNLLAALTNLFLARQHLICRTCSDEWCAHRGQNRAKMAGVMGQRDEIQTNSSYIAPRMSSLSIYAARATLTTLSPTELPQGISGQPSQNWFAIPQVRWDTYASDVQQKVVQNFLGRP